MGLTVRPRGSVVTAGRRPIAGPDLSRARGALAIVAGVLAWVAGALAAGPFPAAAQEGALVSSTFTAIVPAESGPIPVRLRHRIRLDGATRDVPFSFLFFSGARVRTFQATVEGHPVEVILDSEFPPRLSGVLRLPLAGGITDSATVFVEYEVESARRRSGDRVRVTLPVLAVEWPPADPRPATFEALTRFPPEIVVRASFPTGFRSEAAAGGGTQVRTELPVLPSVMTYDAGPAGGPGFIGLVEWAILLLLGALALLGAHRLVRLP